MFIIYLSDKILCDCDFGEFDGVNCDKIMLLMDTNKHKLVILDFWTRCVILIIDLLSLDLGEWQFIIGL